MSNVTCTALELLIFDLDGTLINSETDLAASVNATRERLNLDPLSREIIASYVGHGVPALVRRALGEDAPPDQIEPAINYFLDYYNAHMLDHTHLYPGVREALSALRDRKLAVLTNKPVNFSRRILQGLGAASFFEYIYGGNSFEFKKPDPVGILRLMKDTSVPAERTMMIGDSDTDVLTGQNAGVWTCAVTYGIGSHSLRNAPSDFVIDDFHQVVELAGGNGGIGRPAQQGCRGGV